MSTTEEIRAAAKFLDDRAASYVLLHCQSTYPAALHNIHLRFMETLRGIHPAVGYSGHERGIAVSIGAVALGAVVIERHITLDREMEGPDHAASLEPEEFKALVAGIREVEAARGEPLAERALSQGELINRENLAKSLVAARAICGGHRGDRGRHCGEEPGPGPVAAENARADRPQARPCDGGGRLFLSERSQRRCHQGTALPLRPALGRAGSLSRRRKIPRDLPAGHHRVPSQLQRHGARSGGLSVRNLRSRFCRARAGAVRRQQADGSCDTRRSLRRYSLRADPGGDRHHARA